MLKAGDVIALSGPLGAGKTTFARALITRLGGAGEVPSPTFALMQRYETPHLTLTHCDFYRLEPPELDELGLDDALSEGAVLVEWPERAARLAAGGSPRHRHRRDGATPNTRRIVLTGTWELGSRGSSASGAGELPRRHALCRGAPPATCKAMPRRAPMRGSCLPDRSAVLMNSPRQPDGPPIRDGKPYSALVHLAEDVTPFVAVAGALRERGPSAPAIYAFDLDRGFLILEDLGDRVFGGEVARGRTMAELWAPGRRCARGARRIRAPRICCRSKATPLTGCRTFDAEAMLTEASLLIDWFWPALHGRQAPRRACRGVRGAVASASGGGGKRPTWAGCSGTIIRPI